MKGMNVLKEIVNTAHWLLRNEGLFVGSSSALNVATAIRTARKLSASIDDKNNNNRKEKRLRVVTVICESGSRHLSRFWNPAYITSEYNLQWPDDSSTLQI